MPNFSRYSNSTPMCLSSRNSSNYKGLCHIMPCVAPLYKDMLYSKTGVPWQMNNILIIIFSYILYWSFISILHIRYTLKNFLSEISVMHLIFSRHIPLNCLPDHPVSRRIQQCDQCLIRIFLLFIRRHPHSVLRKSRKKAQAFLVVYFWYRICPSTHIPEDKTRHSIAVFLVSPFNLSK